MICMQPGPWRLAAGLAFVLATGAAQAAPISSLVVFGDSNVDIGRLAVELATDPDDGAVVPPNTVGGRSADGTILPEFLSQRVGVPQLNFGWGGATAGTTNIVGILNPAAPDALPTGTLSQLVEYEALLGGGMADPHALHLVFAGSNDLFFADKNDQTAVDAAVASADANLRGAVTTLDALGARTIVVATRTARPVLSDAATVTDEADPDARNDAAGRQLNAAIAVLVADLDAALAADVLLFDSYGIIREIIDGSGSNGFTAYSDDPSQYCTPGTDCSTLINYDAAHKTSAVHSVLADRFIDQFDLSAKPAPVPLPATAWLLLSGLAAVAALRRRG